MIVSRFTAFVVDQILEEIKQDRESSGVPSGSSSDYTLTTRHAEMLYAILPEELLCAANDLIKSKRMSLICAASSGRSFFTIRGASSETYTCTNHYCSCKSFVHTVAKSEGIWCKHMLASRLAVAVGMIEKREVDDEEFPNMLCPEFTSLG